MKKAILGVGCVLRSEGLCWKVSMDEANDGHIIIVIIIISIITIIIIIISSSILVESVDDDHRSEGHSGGLLAQRAIWGILDIFLWKTQQMPWISFVVFSQEDIHDICTVFYRNLSTHALYKKISLLEYIQFICCEMPWISSCGKHNKCPGQAFNIFES